MLNRRTVVKGMAAAALPMPALAAGDKARTLRLIHGSNLSSLDPIWTTAPATNDFGMMVYDQLIAVDADYVSRPQMAEGWSVEDDGKSYVFTLRAGLKFHDGEPVRSTDCIASIRRWSVRDGFGQMLAAVTDAMEVIDDKRFRIRLKKRFPLLPDAIGKANSSQCVIMPERFANTDPMKAVTEAIGSGPFRFLKDEFVPAARAAFARFDGYVPRQEPVSGLAGGRAPKIERVEWSFISDGATALAAMQAGEQDYWDSPIPDMMPLLKADPNLVVKARTEAGIFYSFVMNHLQPPFNNPAIRQAVAMAINQADYMTAASGGQPDTSGFCRSFYMCGTPYATETGGDVLKTRDIDKARAALKAAGYQGEKVVLIAAGDPPAVGAISQVSDDLLRRMGFNVELVSTDFASMTQRRVNKGPVDKGGWSVFNSTYGGLGLLNPAVNILMRGAGEDGWFGWANNPHLEELRTQWFDATDDAKKATLAAEVQVEAFKTLPYIPLGYSIQPHVWAKNVTGVFPAPLNAYWNIGKAS